MVDAYKFKIACKNVDSLCHNSLNRIVEHMNKYHKTRISSLIFINKYHTFKYHRQQIYKQTIKLIDHYKKITKKKN